MNGLAPAVQWVTASPVWADAAAEPSRMQAPALLRFASDTFMADLAALLATRPADLQERIADARSFRPRPPGEPSAWDADLPDVKLYQPAHGHFNLVAASLVCRMPGLPDKTLDLADDEQVGFVLRRLVPDDDSLIESAWVTGQTGNAKGWRPVPATGKEILPGEEILPLFPVSYAADVPRRLLVGLIPTSSADTFKAAGALSPFVADGDGAVDPRMDEFETRVLAPLDALREAAFVPEGLTGAAAEPFETAGGQLRLEASRFILLDLAELLATMIPSAWEAMLTAHAPSSAADQQLYGLLDGATTGSPALPTVRAALVAAWDQRLRILGEASPAPSIPVDLKVSSLGTSSLRAALAEALPSFTPETEAASGDGEGAEGAVSAAQEIPKLHPTGALFVVRCVFRRPRCHPSDLVGEPSMRFTIASFFDVDAPARSIRIQLPVKTSLADLRKYSKNVGFVISDQLREQMTRVTDMKRVMKGELASGESFDVGLLCSFSIPVITICALIVLMIFISLLNIVFWWMPFLRICLPISLKGKSS